MLPERKWRPRETSRFGDEDVLDNFFPLHIILCVLNLGTPQLVVAQHVFKMARHEINYILSLFFYLRSRRILPKYSF